MRNIIRKSTEKGVSNYTYDKAYRLTGATHPTLTNETFSYDKVGNRLTTQANATPWTYNNADQLLTTPEATYQYNANGHTKSVDYTDTALPDMAYSYDSRERLKRVLKTADGSEIQSNRYDYNNRRLVKTTASTTTYFLYSPKGLESEYDNNGDLVQGYLFGIDIYSTNPFLIYKKNGANYEYHYYHNDHIVTPQRLTNEIGVLSWSADYNAFGETTITKEDITNNLRFPGQYYDVNIKLAQNYYRDYSSELGRYIQSDPIGLTGGINFYGYAYGNPVLFVDPNGLRVTGSWLEKPRLTNPDIDIIWDSYSQRSISDIGWSWWGYVYFGDIDVHFSGNVKFKVKCTDDSDCPPRIWTISGSVQVSGKKRFPVGINIYCSATGFVVGSVVGVGFLAGVGANLACNVAILTTKGVQAYHDKARPVIQKILAKGPTVICLGTSGY